jgi:hypothetical protein
VDGGFFLVIFDVLEMLQLTQFIELKLDFIAFIIDAENEVIQCHHFSGLSRNDLIHFLLLFVGGCLARL